MASDAADLFELQAGPFQSGELHVLSFEGREEMNGLYAFDVTAWAKDVDEAKLEGVLGFPAALAECASTRTRAPRGGCAASCRASRSKAATTAGGARCGSTIAPRLWLLTKRVNSRIFQAKTVQQIADVILDEHGVSRSYEQLSQYPLRQYCVQYEESDYHFLTRILAGGGDLLLLRAARGRPERDGDGARRLRGQRGRVSADRRRSGARLSRAVGRPGIAAPRSIKCSTSARGRAWSRMRS